MNPAIPLWLRWLRPPGSLSLGPGSAKHYDYTESPNSKVAQAAQGFPLAQGEEARHQEHAGGGYPERSLRGTTLGFDSQELVAVADDFPKASVKELIGKLSYSSTFLDAATQAAAEKSIRHAYWALAQYDFVYRPKPGCKVDERAPLFLGVFDWNDSEDDEQLAAWARGEG